MPLNDGGDIWHATKTHFEGVSVEDLTQCSAFRKVFADEAQKLVRQVNVPTRTGTLHGAPSPGWFL